jgi:predicted ArsR family transcriptional regulator
VDDALASRVAAVAALGEPTRRRLYAHVARQPEPVSRDEVAEALRIPRATVAFHLDKLAAEGLLVTSYARRTERVGPGAGRPAKLYRRSERQVAVSFPERHYELAAQLMAAALEDPGRSLTDLARAAGQELTRDGGDVRALLERHGFEPDDEGGEVVLRNCPFHTLARAHPELVCGMALGLVEGMLTGDAGWTARLDPLPGRCCVRLAGVR